MPFTLPPLPYAERALQPVISSRTVALHHGVHHKNYVDTLNTLVADGPLHGLSLEELVRASAGKADAADVFNSAGQVLNHNFYWSSLTPDGGGAPTGALLGQIESDLGGMTAFRTAFQTAALDQFGSGWAWLVWKPQARTLAIETTSDADTPVARGDVPLLTLDVWEHAYYLDHPARRAEYATAVVDKLLNWNWASQQFAKATP